MVNILKQLDNAVNYIEANLCNEIDMDELARIVCITPYEWCNAEYVHTSKTIDTCCI